MCPNGFCIFQSNSKWGYNILLPFYIHVSFSAVYIIISKEEEIGNAKILMLDIAI